MKMKKLANLRPIALVALGVFLGRGAQADTILDFNTTPTGLGNNDAIIQSFGDYATASSAGVTVMGFGTPNIGLTWRATGAQWEYYVDSVWSAAQLNSSGVGDSHRIAFAPNSAAARVVIKSFNFHPYYVSDERYTYSVSVLAGTNVVSGPINTTFLSDATKAHPVSINYTGAPGQTLKLQIARVASTLSGAEIEGSTQNIAVDDITFAQSPTTLLSVGPQVVSVTPDDEETYAAAAYSYRASITNGDTAVVAGSIQLRFDGSLVSPAPTISSAGGLTNVSFQAPGLLTPGSTHTYALTYNDNGIPASSYTNEVRFTVANYQTLPSNYANPSGSASAPGFTYRTVAAPPGTPQLANTLARAKAQLDGTLIDPLTGMPYENSAPPGPNPDGSYNIDTVIDFDDDGVHSGNFTNDVTFPGLSTGFNNSFATKASLYLNLPAGYYRSGVNSDDGFEVSVGIPAHGAFSSQTALGLFDNGRGAADTLFDFLVQTSGIYRFQLIYFEGGGSASCEFFSVNLATGEKILINNLANPNAIKSYRVLTLPPRITSIVRSGPDVVIEWAEGTPPFQVQFKNDLSNPLWNNSGSPTTNRTANVPIQPGAGFIRVVGQ
jgi:hypothetical protein